MEQIQNLTRGDLNFFLNENVQIDIPNFILSLICAVILSFFVQLFYIKYSSTLSNRKEFSKNFVILAVTTCIVIMIVKSSLALSLGMVGALSIVRFRSAIKDPLDIVFMFWSISTGIANGVANVKVSFLATIFLTITIMVLTKIPLRQSAYMLIVKFDKKLESKIIDLINSSTIKFRTKSMSSKGQKVELIGEVRLKNGIDLMSEFSALNPEIETNLIAYNDNILDSN